VPARHALPSYVLQCEFLHSLDPKTTFNFRVFRTNLILVSCVQLRICTYLSALGAVDLPAIVLRYSDEYK